MDKNQIIKYLAIAGGAYLAYWYVTNYGSEGKVSEVGGQTWWDSWFGNGVPTIAPPPPPPPLPAQPTPQPTQPALPSVFVQPDGGYKVPAKQPVVTQPIPTPATVPIPTGLSMRDRLLRASGGVNLLNADQWNWYYGQESSITQTADLFDPSNRGELITPEVYLARRQQAGLGDIVNVPSIPNLPSMSFGGSLKRPGAMGTLASIKRNTFTNRGGPGGMIQ